MGNYFLREQEDVSAISLGHMLPHRARCRKDKLLIESHEFFPFLKILVPGIKHFPSVVQA